MAQFVHHLGSYYIREVELQVKEQLVLVIVPIEPMATSRIEKKYKSS